MNKFLLPLVAVLVVVLTACQPVTSDNSSNTETTPTEAPNSDEATTDSESTETPPLTTETPTVTPTTNLNLPCSSPEFNLEKAVNEAAVVWSGTPYSQPNKTDCSGMFHKILDELRKNCPEAVMPNIDQARSSRDLAAWYHQNGQLKIVSNPESMTDWIQPGAVMFDGYGDRLGKYEGTYLSIDSLTKRSIGINHVSIVTSVERENGEVVAYEMFHGRNESNPAGITESRKVYSYDATLPMYGNHAETWVGVTQTPMSTEVATATAN